MKRALVAATVLGTALVAGTPSSQDVVAAEPLGRLFFTPAQRSALDAGKKIGEPRAARASLPRGPREITLDGVVTRSDGESMVWVNGRSLDSEPPPGVSATVAGSDPAAAQIKLRGVRDPLRLRVGQRVDSATGRISEVYEDVSGNTTGNDVRTHRPGKELLNTTAPSPAETGATGNSRASN
jgi:hypothetical protein